MSGTDGIGPTGFNEEDIRGGPVSPHNPGASSPIPEDISGDISLKARLIADRLTLFEKGLEEAKARVIVINDMLRSELDLISRDNEAYSDLLRDNLQSLSSATHYLKDQVTAIGEKAGVVKRIGMGTSEEITNEAPERIFSDLGDIESVSEIAALEKEGQVASCCHLIDLIRSKVTACMDFFHKLWKTIYNILKKLLGLMKLGVFSKEFWDSIRVRYALFQDPRLLGHLTRLGFSLSNFDRHNSESSLLPDLYFNRFSENNFLSHILDDVGGLMVRLHNSAMPKRVRDRLQLEINESLIIFDQMLAPALSGVRKHISCITANLEGLLEFSENIMARSTEDAINENIDENH